MEFSVLDARVVALMPAAVIVIKATAVLVVALVLATVMQRASATSRHLVWVASLFALLAIPTLAMWSPIRLQWLPSAWGTTPLAVPSVDATAPATVVASKVARSVSVPVPTASPTADTRRVTSNQSDPLPIRQPPSLLSLIAIAWAAVAVGVLAWLAYGVFCVRRIVHGATPLNNAQWQGPMMDIADRLELTTVPLLLRADAVTMPFACGLRTPTIVLPGDCDAWSDERRTAVLLHELAHIRRRDIVGHTLGRIVCALYWFHPMAWMAARRMRAESERACDDLALGCGTRASDYAEHLLDIVTSVRNHGTPSVAMAMATRSEFEGRMLAILDPHLSRTAPTRMQASTLAGGVMMFAIVTGAAVPRVEVAPVAGNAQIVMDTPVASEAPVMAVAPLAPVSPKALLAAKAPVRGAETLATLQSVRFAGDSSVRASVLARILRTDSSALLRRTAAWGLNDYTDNDVVRDALLFALRQDPSAAVREMCAWALADADLDLRVTMALAYAIRADADKAVRQTAIWSLAEGADARSPGVIGALTFALGDKDSEVREVAAWGLGNASPKRAPSELVEALSDRDATVRSTVAWALFQIEDGETAPALDMALQKEMDSDAKWAMVRAISVMGERGIAPLQRIIEGSDTAARALAIRALAHGGADPWPQPRPRPRPSP